MQPLRLRDTLMTYKNNDNEIICLPACLLLMEGDEKQFSAWPYFFYIYVLFKCCMRDIISFSSYNSLASYMSLHDHQCMH